MRVAAVAAGFALVVSFITGLISGNPFGAVLARSLAGGIVFAALTIGAMYLIQMYLPELLSVGNAPTDTAERQVDITIPEENPHGTRATDEDGVDDFETVDGEDGVASEVDDDIGFLGADDDEQAGNGAEAAVFEAANGDNASNSGGPAEPTEPAAVAAGDNGPGSERVPPESRSANATGAAAAESTGAEEQGGEALDEIEELAVDDAEEVDTIGDDADDGGFGDTIESIDSDASTGGSSGSATESTLGVDAKEVAQALRTVLRKDEG